MDNAFQAQMDVMGMIRRRKWAILIPVVVVFGASVITAFLLPPVYRAATTILIEKQDVPVDFVKTTISTYAEQQMQIIKQRIMSSTRLLEIIDSMNLYPEMRERAMTEEIVERMRQDISLEPISANVVDPKTGRPTAVTIAFTISYEGERDPAKVLQVANVLASLFLEENTRVRERQAGEVSSFLQEELAKVKSEIEHTDGAIARFKAAHLHDLPEFVQVNMQSIADTQRSIDLLTNQLNQLKEKEVFLKSQLESTPAEFLDTDRKTLYELKTQLVALRQQYSDDHPDVIKTRAQIRDLEQRIQSAEGSWGAERPENPAYINLNAQLKSVRLEIDSVAAQIRDLGERLVEYKRRVELSPGVESEYRSLLNERNNLQMKYDDLMKKYMESRISHGLEKEQKGERFTIIDPARLPEKPYKPNRILIMAVGFVLGISAGMATAALREYSDTSVKDAEMISAITSFPVLASIPRIVTEGERRMRKKIAAYVGFGVAGALVVALITIHAFVMDLSTVWVRLVSRLGV